MNDELIEDCPICKEHALKYNCLGFPTCANCGWWPSSMPYDNEDIERGIKKYKESIK